MGGKTLEEDQRKIVRNLIRENEQVNPRDANPCEDGFIRSVMPDLWTNSCPLV